MTVRRTLPSRERAFVGAWCFVDHYGPDDVAATGGMDVAPHPHAGLATVSWLFAGEVEHRDSAGVHAMVLPGELNLMTAGAGIAHSEVSTQRSSVLHGVQLWVVLPSAQAEGPRDFQHYAPEPVDLPGVALRVFVGALAGSVSPVRTATPLLGAEARLAVGARWQIPVGTGFEHAVLVDSGEVTLNGRRLLRGELGVVDAGPERLDLATTGDGPARLLLLGGEPFDEPVVMWWNFIGRSHDEIARQREQWESGAARFGPVPGYSGAVERIPAPTMPNVRLRPRTRRGMTAPDPLTRSASDGPDHL
jgi:redox-sensitive bicupin YhaK (pirin superfamily)